jgi:glutathione S-transferase
MAILMHDLAGADPSLRFSPFCWRAKLALAHKGLAVETIPWRFTDKAVIAFSGQKRVPVIRDGETVVADSWAIAEYLDRHYPDRPSLFGGELGRAHARFIATWADTTLNGGIVSLIIKDIWDILDGSDKPFFRDTRQSQFGRTLEAIQAGREERLAAFRASLAPLRLLLQKQDWLGGAAPSYADFIVFGSFLWARCASRFELLDPADGVAAWRERMLDLLDGLGRNARTV